MIDEAFKDELGSFEQSHLDFDMGDNKIFKGFVICNNRLHILFEYKGEPNHHPLNCEPAENYLFSENEFGKILKEFACKDVREYILNKRNKNGK